MVGYGAGASTLAEDHHVVGVATCDNVLGTMQLGHAHRPATRHPFARTERSDVLLHPLHGQALVLEAGITRGMSRILDMSTAGKSVSEWGKTLGQS